MQSDIYIIKLNWYTTVVIQRARHFLLKLQHFSWFSSEFLFPNISISKLLNFNRVSILFEKKKILFKNRWICLFNTKHQIAEGTSDIFTPAL